MLEKLVTNIISNVVKNFYNPFICLSAVNMPNVPIKTPDLPLIDILFFAVPKKKVSHTRKRKRHTGDSLKPLQNLIICKNCGKWKLMHHLCLHCIKKGDIGVEYDIY